jgi:ABC-type protease/lipase transport system fused ATPase/permease subunit
VVDKPCTKEHVELVRGLLKSVEAAFEMTHFERAIIEAEGLANVHVLLHLGVEGRSVDVQLAHFKVAGGRDGKD